MSLPQVCSDVSVSKFYVYSSLVFYLFFNTPDTSSTYWRSFSTTNYNFDYHLIHFIYTHSSCLYWETKKKCELLSYPKSKCVINEMAKTAGYEAVHIPPYHCELIPIEWAMLVASKEIHQEAQWRVYIDCHEALNIWRRI